MCLCHCCILLTDHLSHKKCMVYLPVVSVQIAFLKLHKNPQEKKPGNKTKCCPLGTLPNVMSAQQVLISFQCRLEL